jgi:signal transduction histidine kinase
MAYGMVCPRPARFWQGAYADWDAPRDAWQVAPGRPPAAVRAMPRRGLGGLLQSWWHAWVRSFDPREVAAASDPKSTLFVVMGLVAAYGALGYVPALARASGFQRPWIAIGFVLVGGLLTYAAWRERCAGPLGQIATLLDNGCYAAAMVYAAVAVTPDVGMVLALVYAVAFIAFNAQTYGFSTLFAGVLALPTAVALGAMWPAPSVTMILVTACPLVLLTTTVADHRRVIRWRQEQLVRALGTAQSLAEQNMEPALATKLIAFGHFVHELRNHQAMVALGLTAIERKASQQDRVRAALATVNASIAAEHDLVHRLLHDLRQKTRSATRSFALQAVLDRLIAEGAGVVIETSGPPMHLRGVPDHLETVLENLVRNAAEAGARRLLIRFDEAREGDAAELLVSDDGPGIPGDRLEHLFAPFDAAGRPHGTGLGLYLCRRYLELMGGTIEVSQGPLPGGAFKLRLPLGAGPEAPSSVSVGEVS